MITHSDDLSPLNTFKQNGIHLQYTMYNVQFYYADYSAA